MKCLPICHGIFYVNILIKSLIILDFYLIKEVEVECLKQRDMWNVVTKLQKNLSM